MFSNDINGLSVSEIKKDIKNKHSVSATYQGINKILNSLLEEDIVKKKKDKWTIKKEWVENIKRVCENYNNKDEIPSYNPEMKSISFTTIGKAFEFITTNIESGALRNSGEEVFLMHVKNIGFFGLEKKQMDFLKRFAKNTECHVMIEKNNFINRLVGKYLKSFGCNVYMGVPRSTPHTITIYGNTLYNTFANLDLTAYMTKMYEKIRNISNPKTIKLFSSLKDDKRFNIKFTFETDKQIIEQTKEYLLDIAKKKKV